jgi:phosphocarrier protein
VKNDTGIHARPAAMIVKTASKYKARIKLVCKGREVDAKSIMGIMTLAAMKGTKISVLADGEDETEACSELCALIDGEFAS